MSRFFAELWAVPSGGLSALSRFVVANGVFYMLTGLVLLGAAPLVPLGAVGVGAEQVASSQVNGVLLTIVGWFYVMGGRTGAASFALATVVDRLLVPFVLVPLVLFAGAPALVLAFAVLDPLLALWALAIWARQR
jgi:hypothetical protein